jgi:hypothetical protein
LRNLSAASAEERQTLRRAAARMSDPSRREPEPGTDDDGGEVAGQSPGGARKSTRGAAVYHQPVAQRKLEDREAGERQAGGVEANTALQLPPTL